MFSNEIQLSASTTVLCLHIIPKQCWFTFSTNVNYNDRKCDAEISFVFRYWYNFDRKCFLVKIIKVKSI